MSTPQDLDQDLAASGGYELLRQRLAQQGEALLGKAGELNAARLAAFGRAELRLAARTRARTENNCIARDLVRVGDLLLFGYNVYIGLRKETRIDDVFSLYHLNGTDDAVELVPVPTEGSFLADARFGSDFRELYAYYKNASLRQLRVTGDKLLAAFQIGARPGDLRVFRWQLNRDGGVQYIDNRGERDIVLPPSHDFEWTPTGREHHVNGKHPHINILDTLFVETIGGDLTVKVENNTDVGLGIYSEPVEDTSQSLTDAEISYARLGTLILLRILPYRETAYRYLVFNTRTRQVIRIDGIGASCVQLPEDHGIVFPGGCYLQSGEYKTFTDDVAGMKFKRMIRSPNGEDVLYAFYEPEAGRLALLAYNLIEKTLSPPLFSNGYARFDDGRLLMFNVEGEEPTRNHAMQLWNTPFCSDEHAAGSPPVGFFGRIGNGELVRGISELYGIARATREQSPSRLHYEDLERGITRLLDSYFWLDSEEAGQPAAALRTLADTARLTLDEFDKVAAIRQGAAQALRHAESQHKTLLTDIAATLWRAPQQFVDALARLRALRGELLGLTEQRYIDHARLQTLDADLAAEQVRLSDETIRFLANPQAFAQYHAELDQVAAALPGIPNVAALTPQLQALDTTANGLDLLTELLAGLERGDATVRTRILDDLGEVYARLNQVRATARSRRDQLAVKEASAEFGAQFKLFGQSVANGVDLATTPEQCDETLTQLLTQLEELETRFGGQDTFLVDIVAKREAVHEAFASRRQALLDARQQRAQSLGAAARRILESIEKRLGRFTTPEALHSYFAADPMVQKLRGLIGEMRQLNDTVQADTLEARIKTLRDNAVRIQRDQGDLFNADGIRLGRHTFTVTTQPFDLTLVHRQDALALHLTGTDYFEPLDDERLTTLRPYWAQQLVSETDTVYRAEYLAWRMLGALHAGELDAQALEAARISEAGLLPQVRDYAATRYHEGYQKGVHDVDAAALLAALLPMDRDAGLLRHGPQPRALAALFWTHDIPEAEQAAWRTRADNARRIRDEFGQHQALTTLTDSLAARLADFVNGEGFALDTPQQRAVVAYLLAELTSGHVEWVVSSDAQTLVEALHRQLERRGALGPLQEGLKIGTLHERWTLARHWCEAVAAAETLASAYAPEAAALLLTELPRQRAGVALSCAVEGLVGQHARIKHGTLALDLNEFRERLARHDAVVVPAFNQLQALRHKIVDTTRRQLRLEQYQAKPLSGFVRNKLIDEVYLHLIGDNLAKQIGTAGESRRGDLMGLLLLISPPGYGKTTLMEYVANRLGLVFVRVNGPALGHRVTSLDPAQADSSAARQELERLNFGLALGNNVMLYVDDIQHTSPEFLQRFIALCDGTRRIEGVWQGEARQYDLRGKRFCVVMAGNPYTESGEAFRIPDMLANRADIYNLGDVLSGKEHLFARSYIENSLTANPVLAPLANREPADLALFLRLADGEEIALTEFKHGYSAAEVGEIVAVLQKLFAVRDVLMKVNAAYIASAAQADAYRVEPPFKLQGSYRNMTKLAIKVSAIMNDAELADLVRDHYLGEAQTLTHGAEENLLKLAELQGALLPEQAERWGQIKRDFLHHKRMGGADADGATKLAQQVSHIVTVLSEISERMARQDSGPQVATALLHIEKHLATGETSNKLLARTWRDGLVALENTLRGASPQINVLPQPELLTVLQALAHAYEHALIPVISAMQHKIRLDHDIWDKVIQIGEQIKTLEQKTTRNPQPATK
ncbi:DNA repair ATPase [Chitiniphilus eburneus]|uniref:AAA family ATPase n=1 Tax=Chitiniphilus eburneus TaxID=2571148 RepID=A0A4U0PFI4_9NEIS|nr:DNA repair ATPase [Chitiniphilus eburneus]TJZ66673.1 AAA family ATPase [Chitiniphilus eburneus]